MSATALPPQVQEIDVATARGWLDSGQAMLIDVREPDEHARERIAGSMLLPLSKFDPWAVSAPAGKRVIVHCRSGARSNDAARRLAARPELQIYSIAGGIEAWKRSGQPVLHAKGGTSISIMRQVQIVAGSLVVIGTALGVLLSPWWLILSGFVGAGLVFAGLSGTCGMAAVLQKMPWNRIDAGEPSNAVGAAACPTGQP